MSNPINDVPAGIGFAMVPDEDIAVTSEQLGGIDYSRGVYVGGGGDLSVIMAQGNTLVFVGVTAGSVLPIRVKQLNSASTATDVIALA